MKELYRKSKFRKLLYISVSMALVLCATYFLTKDNRPLLAEGEESSSESNGFLDETFDRNLEPYFYQMTQKWTKDGIEPGNGQLEINMSEYTEISPEMDIEVGAYQGKNETLLWNAPGGWVEYEVDVPKEGLYEIGVEYLPFSQEDGGSRQSAILSAEVNGAYPYRESRSIDLQRVFRDQEAQFDQAGSQVRSLIEEITEWNTVMLHDSGGANVAPLLFHLKEGKNTIRLHLLRESVAFNKLIVQSPKTYDTYEEVKANYPSGASQTGEVITIESEDFSSKSSTSVQVQYDRDPLTTPKSMDKIKFNSLGGMSWYQGGQTVTWEFEVPEDGEYKLGFRGLQNYQQNLSVFRTIYIDGEIPFEEMKAFQIPYKTGWQEIIVADDDGIPYSFYLEKGTHTISFEVTHEPFMPLIIEIDDLSRKIREIAEELRLASGGREDSFRVWNVEKELPNLLERLEDMQVKFEEMTEKMIEINGQTSNISQAFNSLARDVSTLLAKPNEIPNKQVTVGRLQERVENQRQELMNGPLQLDKQFFAPLKEEFPRMTSKWYEKIVGAYHSLMYSFSGQNELKEQEDDELNVWMMWGRDYAEELQQLANQHFTPEHGIKVNVNLIQDANLLILAKAAGIMPDVALGIPSGMPFEMALRGAALDFTTLPDFEEVIDQYAPGTTLPYFYDGGFYGIPETINFKVLFYRKDILSELELDVPDTWDDVYQMIPTLLQNQYNFFVDPKDFSYMMYQNDVELYTDNGMASGLDQPNAFAAFEEWTNLFNLHGLDLQVQSFYQQFRKGEFPIGIADFNQYMQLLVAAPEILDVWGIAPIPGHINEKGENVRWAGGTGLDTTSMMLFNDTPQEKQDLAWEFLKWYSSDDIQTEYGLNLEQFRGETFRWNSANINAFAKMPWRQADLAVILEQWQWVKDIPNVPGSYMTTRQLDFSWNQTVLEGGNPRTELEVAVKEINRELRRKQFEFGLRDEDGNIINSLDLPVIKEPWEGAKKFEQ